jgi:hypothetical protein
MGLLSIIQRKVKGITFQRFTVGIGQSQTFECQFLSATEGENPPKIELLDVVARLEAGLA